MKTRHASRQGSDPLPTARESSGLYRFTGTPTDGGGVRHAAARGLPAATADGAPPGTGPAGGRPASARASFVADPGAIPAGAPRPRRGCGAAKPFRTRRAHSAHRTRLTARPARRARLRSSGPRGENAGDQPERDPGDVFGTAGRPAPAADGGVLPLRRIPRPPWTPRTGHAHRATGVPHTQGVPPGMTVGGHGRGCFESLFCVRRLNERSNQDRSNVNSPNPPHEEQS